VKGFSFGRVRAVMLQHWFIMKHSPIRFFELFYWPILWLVLWGYITRYLSNVNTDIPGGVTVLLGGVVLWDVLFRSQQELHVAGLIDVWDRNHLNLYASPMSHAEYFTGILLFSTARVIVGTLPLILVARLGFGFDLFTAGATLLPALLILVAMGWAMGLFVRAAILRFGMNAEILAWSLVVLVQPASAVFYPVSVLPDWLQVVAWALPASHVFEAMRAFLADGRLLTGELALGAALVSFYVAVGAATAGGAFRAVKVRGLLSRPGY
jgi:ABC-2 type transport system permease protein